MLRIFAAGAPAGKLPVAADAPSRAGTCMPSVFITGISGYVGSALAQHYVEAGARVSGLVRRSSDPGTLAWLTDLGVRLHRGDVEQRDGLERAFDGTDLLLHSAAVIGYRRRLWGAMQRVNVIGTRNVLDAARVVGLGRVVHISSIAAVGFSDRPVLLDEDAHFDPSVLDAAYFDTKVGAELEVGRAVDSGLDVTIVNPGAIYGPSTLSSNSSKVIAGILRRRMPLVPVGGINAVPLTTVVQGVVAAATRGRTGRRYILGGENLTFAELVTRVGHAAGRVLTGREFPSWLRVPLSCAMELVEPLVPDSVWFTPDMCASLGRWMWFDSTRAHSELGLLPGDLDACLADTVRQLRAQGRLPSS
jgi:dihydroflavonol-4-reductase